MAVESRNRRSTDRLRSPSVPWYKRLWRTFANHLRNTKAPMGLIYLGGLVILLGWWAVQHQQETIVNSQRDSDLRATAQALYSQQIQQWASNKAAYELCLDSVDRSDLSRKQWEDIADWMVSIGATEGAERVRNGPVLSSAPRVEADCGPDPGPAPQPPDLEADDGSPIINSSAVEFTTLPR